MFGLEYAIRVRFYDIKKAKELFEISMPLYPNHAELLVDCTDSTNYCLKDDFLQAMADIAVPML